MEKRINDFINNINQIFINELYKYEDKFNKKGEIELFNDFIETYKRSYKMLENNRLVDGLIIARSSFEVLTILIGIHIDKNSAQEYFKADSYERYQQRRKQDSKAEDYVSQNYLRTAIKNRCKSIENDMNKIYKFLSQYAHPTIYRNLLRNIEQENINISKIYFNGIMSIPLIALLIFSDLNLVEKNTMIDMINLKQWQEAVVNKNEMSKIIKVKLDKIEKFMYKEINQDFYTKSVEQQKKELLKIQRIYNKHKNDIEKSYNKTANKPQYAGIYLQCVDMLKAI